MKKIITLLIIGFVFLNLSCKKECKKVITIDKIKTIIEYNSISDSINNLIRFNFKYDSSGFLYNVMIDAKNGGIYYNNVFSYSIIKINETKLVFVIKYDILPRYFKISVDNKQIKSITETDSLGMNEIPTTIIYYNSTIIDSIFDIGYNNTLYYNIHMNRFSYEYNNCKSIHYSWDSDFPNYAIKNGQKKFSYGNLLNTGSLPNQSPTANLGSSVLSLIEYYLNVNGYYILKPNNNLIDSIRTIDSIRNDQNIEKYSYEFTNNKVSKISYFTQRDTFITNKCHLLEYY